MLRNPGEVYRLLSRRDLAILRIIEKFMKQYEHVPLDIIVSKSKMPDKEVSLSLSKLNKLKLVKRFRGDYTGYLLTYLGYDCLALDDLVRRNVIYALGPKLGVGKEADLFRALSPTNEKIVVKFHRIGRVSFRHTRKYRPYVDDKPHISWLLQSTISADREFKALLECEKVEVNVPKVLGRSRHAVVMRYIDGILLYKYRNPADPEAILIEILDSVRKAFLKVGIVHGDLSEFNVMVEFNSEKPIIIDWPQYVEKNHPSAEQLLERDVRYITLFFKKKFKVEVDVEKALRYVRGESESL